MTAVLNDRRLCTEPEVPGYAIDALVSMPLFYAHDSTPLNPRLIESQDESAFGESADTCPSMAVDMKSISIKIILIDKTTVSGSPEIGGSWH
jgi:hypothetical protein